MKNSQEKNKEQEQIKVDVRELIEAFKRIGTAAKEASVSCLELAAILTVIQVRTGRAGTVVGNAVKTILVRSHRPDVQRYLQEMGVDTTKRGIELLKDIARLFKNSNPIKQEVLAEQLGGVFQINVFKVIMDEIDNPTSKYADLLKKPDFATFAARIDFS